MGPRRFRLYLLIFFCFLFGLSLIRNINRINEAKKRVDRTKEKLEKLAQENKRLEEELRKIQKDEFVEKQLRDKLGLAKEGEIVMVLPDTETLKKLVSQIPEEEETLPDPVWKRWMRLFNF